MPMNDRRGEELVEADIVERDPVEADEVKSPSKSPIAVDPPEFLGWIGDYEAQPSGVGDYTLLAFLTSYAPVDDERSALLDVLFKAKAAELREQGLTQRIGGAGHAPECHNKVLCIGVRTDGVRWFGAILNAPNTGGGSPRGSILTTYRGRSIVSGEGVNLPLRVMGDTLCTLHYEDDNALGISYQWL